MPVAGNGGCLNIDVRLSWHRRGSTPSERPSRWNLIRTFEGPRGPLGLTLGNAALAGNGALVALYLGLIVIN